jgi:hypothetical protein
MAVNLSPYGGVGAQFFDGSGNVLTGGKIYTYSAGTTTNQVTYTSASGLIAHSNPIILDASGRVPNGEIWLTDGLTYKFVLKNANDVLIGTYDNLVGINSNFVNFLTETEVQTATAGQTVFTLTTMQYQPGTNNLTVYVDGVNQIDGATYSYVETSSTVITFTSGLHVGALVKFTTAQTLSTGVTDASLVTYSPAGTGAVQTTVQAKLQQYVSLPDYTSLRNALATGKLVLIPESVSTISVDAGDVLSVLAGLRQLVPQSSVQIDLPAGTFTTTTIYSGAPNGAKITVRGASTVSKSITGVSGSGSAGAWSVVFTVTDASGIAIGDFVFIKSIVGTTREKVVEGCWEVTNVSGSNVTCLVKARKSTLPAFVVSSGTMLVAKTVVKVPGAIGIDVVGEGNIFQNMVLVGDGTGTGDISGVRVTNGWAGFARSTALPFGVVNFKEHGFYAILGSVISCFDAYSSGNGQNGLYTLQSSDAQATRLIATGNGTTGGVASAQAGFAASSGNFSGNGQRGLYGAQMASIIAASAIIYDTEGVGVRSDNRAFITLTSSKIAGNTSYGVQCINASANTTTVNYTGGNGAADEFADQNGILQTGASTQIFNIEAQKAVIENHYRVSIALADDAASFIDFGATSVIRTVYFHSSSSAALQGAVRIRTVSTLGTTSIYGTGFTVNDYGTNPTGVLAGTTGADGTVTLSAADNGKFYVENRSGGTRTIIFDVMGN